MMTLRAAAMASKVWEGEDKRPDRAKYKGPEHYYCSGPLL
jgi:hypothetical protein